MNESRSVLPQAAGAAAVCLFLSLSVLFGACQQRMPTKTDDRVQRLKKPDPCKPDRPYQPSSCAAQQDVRDLIARVPGATPGQWTQIARKIVSYGERAVPQMIANLGASDQSVQLLSAYVLGILKDPRSLDALYAASFDAGNQKLRYEAATAMLRMGDRRGLPPMVDALEDADALVRARAILVLKERAGETFGYRADDRPEDRQAAVARWRAWLAGAGGTAGG